MGFGKSAECFRLDWPYCAAARRMASVIMTGADGSAWDDLKWKRRLETFGDDDGPVLAVKKRADADAIWLVISCCGSRNFR